MTTTGSKVVRVTTSSSAVTASISSSAMTATTGSKAGREIPIFSLEGEVMTSLSTGLDPV